MIKRVRRLKISLGAKCRILFGAAIALIIGAALYVPWQRMEQLTEQLDRSAAGALAEQAVQRHVWLRAQATEARPTADDGPTTQPVPPENEPVARLVSIKPSRGGPDRVRFERRAFDRFVATPERRWDFAYYERRDGTEGYRYAQPLFLVGGTDCAACHRRGERGNLTSRPARAAAENEPTTLPAFAAIWTDGGTVSPSVAAALMPPPGGAAPLIGLVSVDMPSRIDANQLLLNRVFIFTAGLLAGTLAVIAFYLITTRLILQPVRVLQETAEKVSEGDLNIRSDISTGDEFQQLSQTFNVMLANMKDSQDQLRSINKSLDLRLGQLAESNLALYESNRLKSEFLANVSHELRTPLNSILGFADLLKDALARSDARSDARNGSDANKGARYVGNILQSGRHLLDLINDLLDLAKIEAGKMEIRSEALSLGDLFEGLGNILKPLLEQKDLTLTPYVAPEVPIIRSDPAKLQQVLYNFLSNAIKFSPTGGQIDLTASRDDEGHVRIAVTDRGPGIAAENQRLIFEKFRQLDGGMTRTHGGTGLGLSISKELVTILGGSIGVRSALGEGATFWVILPLHIASGAADVRSKLVLT